MRMGTSSLPVGKTAQHSGTSSDEAGQSRKVVHNASSKVSLVVRKMLFPLLDSPMHTHVALDSDADQVELDLLDQVERHKPGIIEDDEGFMQHIQKLLTRYRRQSVRYALVPTG
jgi:hypothetical protein